MTKQNESLVKILHKPVTFTKETLQKDTDELNKSLSEGYTIHEFIKTETGIVYVLGKWTKHQDKVNTKNNQKEKDLKQIYSSFLEEDS